MTAAPAKLSLFKKVVHFITEHCQDTVFDYNQALYLCNQMENPEALLPESDFISRDTAEKIRILLSIGGKTTIQRDGSAPFLNWFTREPLKQLKSVVPPYPLKQHSKVVLQSCQLLLDDLEKQTVNKSPVPYQTFSHIQTTFEQISCKANNVTEDYNEAKISSLELTSRMVDMFLQYGINDSANVLQKVIVQTMFFCSGNVARDVDYEVAKYWQTHIVKLLVHGAAIPKDCLMYIHKLHPKDTVYVCVSMLDHQLYYLYREQCRELERQEEEAREEERAMEWGAEDDRTIEQKRKSDEKRMHQESYEDSFPTCRNLMQLCRLQLYECVPNRNMATCAKQLPLPRALKSYLTIGFQYAFEKKRGKSGHEW